MIRAYTYDDPRCVCGAMLPCPPWPPNERTHKVECVVCHEIITAYFWTRQRQRMEFTVVPLHTLTPPEHS